MNTGVALLILGVTMAVVIGYQVFCGTDRVRRFVACCLKLGVAYAMYFVAIPNQPETDVGRFADALTRSHGERLAAILERKQQEKVDALQYATDR